MKKTVKKSITAMSSAVNKAGLPITDVGSRLHAQYTAIAKFIKANSQMSFINFDYTTSRDLILCTFFQSADLDSINITLKEIRRVLPHLINIFNSPVIHLTDDEVVLPLDTVKRVNHKSIRHLALRADDWRNIDVRGGVMPKRLLTKVPEDDFSIYENVVFYHLIEKILKYLRRRIYRLSEILETLSEGIKLEDFGKTNHAMYYLAIGKLYVGFHKHDNDQISDTLENLTKLYRQISLYKTCEVHAKNTDAKSIIGGIKKTNIFSMHKDYKHVYTLYRAMDKRINVPALAGVPAEQTKSQRYYEKFCQLLTLFAITHFNFEPHLFENVLEDGKADASLKFKNWTVSISVKREDAMDCNLIDLTVMYKKKNVRYVLIPISYYVRKGKRGKYEKIISELLDASSVYDKYIFLEPFDLDGNAQNDYSMRFLAGKKKAYYAILPVSISDANSFRRIQNILLECMTRTAWKSGICAFCGEVLNEVEKKLLCHKCRTAIQNINCVNCNKKFMSSYFDAPKTRSQKTDAVDCVKFLSEFLRQEIRHKFRNTTKIKGKSFICPHCDGENKISTPK